MLPGQGYRALHWFVILPRMTTSGLEIAVVGMACRFPGAPDVEAFWHNMVAGTDSISRLDRAGLRAAGAPDALLDDPDFVPARGVLDEVDLFAAEFFGVAPAEASLMDPQHRLLLELAHTALEHAGYDPRRPPGSIGVYAGASPNSYALRLLGRGDLKLRGNIGHTGDFLATRLAYALGLEGPAVNVQSACSTSLVAVHLACQALLAGDCDLALAGGVSVRLPQWGHHHTPGGITSPDGYCRAFDAEAAGTVSGSGLGLVVLQRLEDARAEGATLHALVQGTAINNDGDDKVGYAAPGVRGQVAVIRQAHEVAEVSPREIEFVEAHGTGTALGDPIEVEALSRAFGAGERGYCALAAVKSNIGHLDATAGIAGFIRAALTVREGVRPPSLHCDRPNPAIDFASSPFFVNTAALDWPGPVRVAGVSSFGIGGTNAHVVLQSPPPSAPASHRGPFLLPVSAATETALAERVGALADALDSVALGDLAHTLQVGRTALGYRAALVARDQPSAREGLGRIASHVAGDGRVGFMFPGQGAQTGGWAGLRAAGRLSAFSEVLDRAGPLALEGPELRQTQHTQPTMFALGYALARQWMSWGVEPAVVFGHSLGELVAACVAGVFGFEEGLALVRARGALMQACPPGAMLAVMLEEGPLRDRLPEGLDLAGVNGARQCTVAGPSEAVATFAEAMRAEGVACVPLETSHAFHSRLVESALPGWREALSRCRLRAPQRPIVSSVTGAALTAAEATDPEYWVEHARAPVRFSAALAQAGEVSLLEVGAGRTLTGLARGRDARSTFGVGTPSLEAWLQTAGELWCRGVPLDWSTVGDGGRRVPLPTYPFERRRYWIEGTSAPPAADAVEVYVHTAQPLPAAEPSAERRSWVLLGDAALAGELGVARVGSEALSSLDEGTCCLLAETDAALATRLERIRTLNQAGRDFVLLTRGAIELPAAAVDASAAAAAAVASAAAHEPGGYGRVIDLALPFEGMGARLRRELDAAGPPIQVALGPRGRYRPGVARVTGLPAPAEVEGKRVVVFGGGGRVGAALVERMRGRGAEVIAPRRAEVDVTDAEAVSALFETHRPSYVLHLAGLVGAEAFRTLAELDADTLGRITRAKIMGARAIERAVAACPIEACVLFSSLAGVLGGPGSAAYAAGNRYLDAFALQRGAPFVSLAWGGIGEAGISVDQVDTLTWRLVRSGLRHALVWRGDLAARLAEAQRPAAGVSRSRHPRPAMAPEFVAPRDPEEARIAAIWSEVLGVEPVGVADNFFELGGTSVLGLEVVARLRAVYGEQHTVVGLYEHPTVAALAAVLRPRAEDPLARSRARGLRRRERRGR